MKYFFAFLFSFCLVTGAKAYDVPTLQGPVMDTAHMLSAEGAGKIESAIRQIYSQRSAQIQVVTIPTLGDETIEQVGIQFADKWKIGDAKIDGKRTDNGIIILIAAKERKIRIEVGSGLEGDIPDAIASRIIHEVMIPYFKNGQTDDGVLAGILSINKILSGQELQASQPQDNNGDPFSFWILIFVLFLFFGWPFLAAFLGISIGGGRGGYYGGGSFGGGGGWSGGGGGFSGGGASGGW